MAGNITVAGPAGGMYPDTGWEGDLTSVVFLPGLQNTCPALLENVRVAKSKASLGNDGMAQCNGGSWMGSRARKGREVETKEI